MRGEAAAMPGEAILVVDDDPRNLKLVEFILTTAGYQVHSAVSAEEALKVLSSCHPRLILTDLQLPGMDGLELASRLRAAPETKDIIIIAFTAYSMKGDVQRARRAGCDEYVTKPVERLALLSVVERYLAAPGR